MNRLCLAQPVMELLPEAIKVFLPKVSICCGEPILLSSEGSNASLFTRTGCKKAKVYKGKNMGYFKNY